MIFTTNEHNPNVKNNAEQMLAFKVKIKYTNEENTRFKQNSCPSQY